MVADKFKRFYNFLAQMGLVIRDDPPKVIDMTGRDWGKTVDGLALSIRELGREGLRQVAGISVVMKNGGANPKTFTIPSWISFYKVEGVELTPYGQRLMSSEQNAKKIPVMLGPGDAIESDLPIPTLYDMRVPGSYRISVSCRLHDETTLRSNEIVIRV